MHVSESLCVWGQVVLVGDCSVGKTCLLFRFVSNEFMSASYISTVGVDMKVRN